MKNRSGYAYGIAAYLLWGAFPFYFNLLDAVDPLEVIPWRVITSLIFCLLVIALGRQWKSLRDALSNPRQVGWFLLSALLLYANWQIFVSAVMSGQILETALGYFITPLVTILIGVLIRRETLRKAQWWAVGIAAIGVVVSAAAYGSFPLVALGIALSFGFYGAVHQHASATVDALSGLTVETLLVLPVALIQLWLINSASGHLTSFEAGATVTLLLLGSGIVTAIPLLLFGAASRRLPLSHLGFIQFLTPVLNFLTGYFIFHEVMSPTRWFGFATVWLALFILITDMLRQARRGVPLTKRATSSANAER